MSLHILDFAAKRGLILRKTRRAAMYLPLVAALFSIISCSGSGEVKEYFGAHGYSYPVDVSGVSMWGIQYSGIADDELLDPGARDFIEAGMFSIRDHFSRHNVQALVPGAEALIVGKPVLYRAENGEVGLMVEVIAYGEGKPGSMVRLPVEWLSAKRSCWKVVNFAYFNRNGLYKWQHNGWVY